jgi:hypothetical protein
LASVGAFGRRRCSFWFCTAIFRVLDIIADLLMLALYFLPTGTRCIGW